MKAGIINYEMGNINSVINSLKFLGINSKVINSYKDFNDSSHLILPGVGSFKMAMENLKKFKLIDEIKESVLIKKKKILGICLGMQLLGHSSTEDGFSTGLSFISNKVEKFNQKELANLRVPHVGYNQIIVDNENCTLLKSLDNQSNFYFVHSYKMEIGNLKNNYAVCNYGTNFLAAFQNDNICGVQFHPEKSQSNGIQILYNFFKYQ
tara:strand:+ start:12 stop:635 length:624 start_codon:yes stop_codon:yes gene_type:complete